MLVLIGKRFGLERIGPEYFKLIKRYMRMGTFCGIVGGKPRFAYYFVGHLERPGVVAAENLDGFEMMMPLNINSNAVEQNNTVEESKQRKEQADEEAK